MKEKIKNFLKKLGIGSLYIGGFGVMSLFGILNIIFVWGIGLYTAWYGISLLISGSIVWGLLVLFIGLPLIVGLADFLFIPFIIISIFGIIWMLIKVIFF